MLRLLLPPSAFLHQLICWGVLLLGLQLTQNTQAATWRAGAAKENITPSYKVPLGGSIKRSLAETHGSKLYARALALSWAGQAPALLISVDTLAIPTSLRTNLLKSLEPLGITDERLILCATTTHSSPVLTGITAASASLSKEELQSSERYSAELQSKLLRLGKAAVSSMVEAELSSGRGVVRFAIQRTEKSEFNFEGPFDHALPLIVVTKAATHQKIATLCNYACTANSIGSQLPQGDWPGFASAELESRYPDLVALTTIGAGSDQSPVPRHQKGIAQLHGTVIAKEIVRLLQQNLKPLSGELNTQLFASTDNTLRTWSFSDKLLMLFLEKPAALHDALGYKRSLDASKLWVTSTHQIAKSPASVLQTSSTVTKPSTDALLSSLLGSVPKHYLAPEPRQSSLANPPTPSPKR